MFIDKPSWGTFVWFGVISEAVFLGFGVVIIAMVKVRDIGTINGRPFIIFVSLWGLLANVRLAAVAKDSGGRDSSYSW